MFYYVYILRSLKNGSLYTSYTTNLKQRFKSHNIGENLATKPYLPYELIFYEAFLNIDDAKSREEYLKSGWGLKALKNMLKRFLTRRNV